MTLRRKNSTYFLTLTGLVIFASCSVDTSGIRFDDDEYDSIVNPGDGDSGDGDSGDGDSGGGGMSGDGDSGDGDVGDGDAGDGDSGMGGMGGVPEIEEPECTESGQLRCDGRTEGQVQACTGTEWIDIGDSCPYVCEDGACTGVCMPGTSECLSSVEVRTCNTSGKWSNTSCTDSACVPQGADTAVCGGSCQPGARGCGGSGDLQPQVCDSEGNWVDNGSACGGACTDGVCTGTCMEGDKQCAADGSPLVCDATSNWPASGTPCPFYCVGGECSTGDCFQDELRCDPDNPGKGMQRCNAQGEWDTVSDCPFACDGEDREAKCIGVCNPGEKKCSPDGTSVVVCSEDYQWKQDLRCGEMDMRCISYVTSKGVTDHICGDCQPGGTKCAASDNAVETCAVVDKEARWVDPKACEDKTYCHPEVGKCLTAIEACPTKESSGRGCYSPNQTWTCRASEGAIAIDECGLAQTCVEGDCTGTIKL